MSKPAFKGQVAALLREFRKDVNNTLHQVFFDKQVGPGEAGTPLEPTQSNVTDELKPKPKLVVNNDKPGDKQPDIDMDR